MPGARKGEGKFKHAAKPKLREQQQYSELAVPVVGQDRVAEVARSGSGAG